MKYEEASEYLTTLLFNVVEYGAAAIPERDDDKLRGVILLLDKYEDLLFENNIER